MLKMKATVFRGKNDIRVEEVERPRAGVGDAVIRVTLTTICGTDLHILRGEYESNRDSSLVMNQWA
jgi:threonine dehydrogenase-like Zn-dependent dehydrogenase